MKVFHLVLILFLVAIGCNGQIFAESKDYKSCIYSFYEAIYTSSSLTLTEMENLFEPYNIHISEHNAFEKFCENSKSTYKCYEWDATNGKHFDQPSIVFQFVLRNQALFTKGKQKEDMFRLIENASYIKQSDKFDYFHVIIDFEEEGFLQFIVNSRLEEAPYMFNIIMYDGITYLKHISKDQDYDQSSLLGMISDPDGYTNLRDSTGTNYPVVQKVLENQIFIYWPTSESIWWKVKTLDSCNVGYMHKSRIKPFNLLDGDVSEDLKMQAERAFGFDAPCR